MIKEGEKEANEELAEFNERMETKQQEIIKESLSVSMRRVLMAVVN
jgi:vacuolar-type H+-ATPase subunit H